MCQKCNDTGWLCGCDLSNPWDGEGNCGCGESGKNCLCNPDGNLGDDVRVIASTNTVEITKIH